MPDSNQDRDIGRLEGKLDAMASQLSGLVEAIRHDQRDASTKRAELYRRVGRIEREVGSIEREVGSLQQSVERLEPFAERARKWEQRGIGALAAVGMMASGITVGMTWLIAHWDRIRVWFRGM